MKRWAMALITVAAVAVWSGAWSVAQEPAPVAPAGSTTPATAAPAAAPGATPAAGKSLTHDAAGERIVPFYGLYCWASDFESEQHLSLVKQTGFRLISTTLSAGEEKGMLVAAKNGIQMAAYFSPNKWAKDMDTEGYRKAVREAVARYGPGGSLWKENPGLPALPVIYWVIDGEPGTELKPKGDLMPDEAYAACLKVAYEEIKAYNKECKVVAMAPIGTPGSTPGPEYVDKERKVMGAYAFIRGVHDHGGFAYYDCIDLHPFSFPMPPDTAGLAAMLTWVKEECRKRGGEKPIWFTEIGFPMAYGPANPFHVTQDQAADYTVRALALSARHDVQCLTLTYVNDQFSPRAGPPAYFLYKAYGFYKDGKMRPIAEATKLMADLMPDPVLLEVLSDGANIGQAASRWSDRPYGDSPFYCYKFKGRSSSEVYVLWTEGRPFRCNLKVPGDKVTLYNRELLGGIVYSKAAGSISATGEMRLPVTGTPIFVSTEVAPEQEKATDNYLKPENYRDWKPIRGAE